MRIPVDLPRRRRSRRPGRRRVWFLVAAAVIVVLVTSLRGIAGFYTDYLWFKDLGFQRVFTGILGAKLLLFFTALVIVAVAVWLNLFIADRLAPEVRGPGPEDEIVTRYREAVGSHSGKVRLVVAAVFAFLTAGGVTSHWNDLLLFEHGARFGTADPQFHKDIGFYVFKLPFYTFLLNWLLLAVVITTIVTIGAHYLNGGIRLQSPTQRGASPQVKAHLSVLLAVIALMKAVGYYLQRFELNFSTRGFKEGAFYTDVHAKLPVLTLLMLISVAAAVLLLVNIQRRGWALPAIAVGLWVFVALIIGGLYPAFIQKFRVDPAKAKLEARYIDRNIGATRAAYKIGASVSRQDFTAATTLAAGDLQDDASTVRNIRLWDPDPNITRKTFANQQSIRDYYTVRDVDVDRYTLASDPTQVVAAVRELDPTKIPDNSWVNRHLTYTHGYSDIVAPANAANDQGFPDYTTKDLPPTGQPVPVRQSAYFGEGGGPGDYAIVNTRQPEIDYQNPQGGNQTSSYAGDRGVALNSTVRRAAFALRFGSINPLISSYISPTSRALYIRNIRDRAHKVAPFLKLDADPYPAVADGQLLWIVDAYTTTSRYPYSQSAQSGGLTDSDLQGGSFNYVRNSVKVTINAYDGTTTLYVSDPSDPIIRAYQRIFPGLLVPMSKASPALLGHFRYPEDIFKVQALQYADYHIDGAQNFFTGADAWNVAKDPGIVVRNGTTPTSLAQVPVGPQITVVSQTANGRIPPTYQQVRLPGDSQDTFALLQPFTPRSANDSQPLLTAFLTARSNPDDYGRMTAYRIPSGQSINGPAFVDSIINTDTSISQQLSLLNAQGSQVLFGNVVLVPIKNSILYVRPLYVQGSDPNNQIPRLERVIVVYGSQAKMEPTLQQALTDFFGSAPATREQQGGAPPGGTTTTPTTPTVPTVPTIPGTPGASPPAGGQAAAVDAQTAQLIAQANTDLLAAQAALGKGDLAGYQSNVSAAAGLLQQAADRAKATPAVGTPPLTAVAPSTAPSVAPAPSSTVPTTPGAPPSTGSA